MPVPMKITGRSSSITNAFVNSIIPVIQPLEKDIKESLKILEMNIETIECIYCGSKYTEWDHLRPLVLNKRPTGYISEIQNLVPSCGKCNQSKGNKEWHLWISSNAKLSPKSKKIPDIDARIIKLKNYEKWRIATKLNIEEICGEKLWELHWGNCENIHNSMIEAQKISIEIKTKIETSLSGFKQNIQCVASTTKNKSVQSPNNTLNQIFTKIHRIKLWANRKDQKNHKIINAYLLLEENDKTVSYQSMAKFCRNKEKYPNLYVSTFSENFAQMKSDSGNSHGKVFYEENDLVIMYPTVRAEVKKYFGK